MSQAVDETSSSLSIANFVSFHFSSFASGQLEEIVARSSVMARNKTVSQSANLPAIAIAIAIIIRPSSLAVAAAVVVDDRNRLRGKSLKVATLPLKCQLEGSTKDSSHKKERRKLRPGQTNKQSSVFRLITHTQ